VSDRPTGPCPTGQPAPCPHASVRSRHAPLSARVRAQCHCPRRRMSTSASSAPPHRRHRRLPSATEADRPLHSDSDVAVRSPAPPSPSARAAPARPELRATRRWPPMPRPPSPASPPRGPSSSHRTSPSRSSLCPSRPPPRPGSAPASSRLSPRSRHVSSTPAPASHPRTLILSPLRSRASLLLCCHCASHAIAPRAPFAAALVRPASPLSGAFILESSRAKKHPRASALLPLPPLPPKRGPHRQ
jgi:hypothetical protein